MKWFQRYGALVIFAVLAVSCAVLHYKFLEERMREEAVEHCLELYYPDIAPSQVNPSLEKHLERRCHDAESLNKTWLSDTFENHQSEYAQLFLQALVIGALGSKVFRKEKEDLHQRLDRIEAAVRERDPS